MTTKQITNILQAKNILNVAPIVQTIDAVHFPGVTEESSKLIQKLIEDNQNRNHIFFNKKKFHNHVVHHILDVYSLGASPARIQAIYEEHQTIQRPIPPRSVKITEENWTKHLENEDLWTDYLDFFNSEITKLGAQETMEKYVFHPSLFPRLYSGVFHPFIQLGFGVEFRLPMVISEGLAEAAMHKATLTNYLSLSPSSSPSLPLLEILEQIRNDKRIDKTVNYSDSVKMDALLQRGPELIHEYIQKWNVAGTEEDVKKKQQELYNSIVFMYGAVIPPGKDAKFDFFLMHALTSSLFVHVLLQHFTPEKGAVILKAHFVLTLIYFIAKGRPTFYIDELKQYKTKLPENNNNPWIEVIKFAINTSDTHAMKSVRALLQAESLYGDNDGIYLKAACRTADTFADTSSAIYSHDAWEQDGVGYAETWAK